MKSKLLALVGATLVAAIFTGCQTTPGPFTAQDTTKYTLDNTEKFVLMDKATQVSVTCTGLQERTNPADGRMTVVANIKNRESRRIQVQVNCVFKDDRGFSTGDELPFRNIILGENETQAVEFVAMNNLARTYTVHVRQAR